MNTVKKHKNQKIITFFLRNFCNNDRINISIISDLISSYSSIIRVRKNTYFKSPIGYIEAAAQTCSVENLFLEISQNSQENNCARVSILIKLQSCDFIKIETLAQVFSCEFCEISNDTFPTGHLRWLLLDIIIYKKRFRFLMENGDYLLVKNVGKLTASCKCNQIQSEYQKVLNYVL